MMVYQALVVVERVVLDKTAIPKQPIVAMVA
jgi:hypothetical protein